MEREAECIRRAIRFYEQGIARLENRWQGNGESGARFSDPHHPYASDLDLFGHASLFELLSIARTRGGEARLAAWLKSASPVAELSARHEAINELRPMLDLREQLAILGDDFRAGVNPDALVRWAAEPAQPFPAWRRIVALLLSVAGLTALLWWLGMDVGNPQARIAVIAVAAVEGLFGYRMRTRILHIVSAVEEPAHDLGLLAEILATLEKQQFESHAPEDLAGRNHGNCGARIPSHCASQAPDGNAGIP